MRLSYTLKYSISLTFCLVAVALLSLPRAYSAVEPSLSDSATNESSVRLLGGDGKTGSQFRIDNTVSFIRNERETKYESSTVFYGDLVFDFIGDNGEIVVYSLRSQKFVLIDPIRRMRTAIEEQELERFAARIKEIIKEEKKDSFSLFLIDPSFEISCKENEYFFQSRWIDYRVTTQLFDNEKIADAYFRFVEAMAKLNVYMNPGVLTPLARIEANKTFMESALFPEKIVMEIYPKGKNIFAKTFVVENTAALARRISERDRNRINRAVHFYEQFPFVSFSEYFEKNNEQ